jgi:subtilisin family serine protease
VSCGRRDGNVSTVRYNSKLDPTLNLAVHNFSSGKSGYANLTSDNGQDTAYARILVRTRQPGSLEKWGDLAISSRTKSIITGFIAIGNLENLAKIEGVEYIANGSDQLLTTVSSMLPTANTPQISKNPEFLKATGKGVLIGIVDSVSNLNWLSSGFTDDDKSRILYLWDQTDQGGSPPEELNNSYGTEYDAAAIKRGLRDDNEPAYSGAANHGKVVADICAGYNGIAPQSDLIFVRTTGNKFDIINGVYYIIEKSEKLNKPVVINLSYGEDLGPHDGTSNFETAIEECAGEGRIIIASGGNSSGLKTHSSFHHQANSGAQSDRLSLSVIGRSAAAPQQSVILVDIWLSEKMETEITVTAPDGKEFGPVLFKEGRQFMTSQGRITILNHLSEPVNGDTQIAVLLDTATESEMSSGEWVIGIKDVIQKAEWECDAWIVTTGSYKAWFTTQVDQRRTISSPGTAPSVIAVSAFHNKGDQRVEFSKGPTRDGRKKPDFYVYSEEGSSYAAPVITGTVALLLENNPSMTVEEVRKILHTYADPEQE